MKNLLKVVLIIPLLLGFIFGNRTIVFAQFEKNNSATDRHFALLCPGIFQDGKADDFVNRAELVQLLFCDENDLSKEFLDSIKIDFKDLSGTEKFIPELKLAFFLKGIKGFSDGTFRPNNQITLEEALKTIFSVKDNIEKTLFGDYVSTHVVLDDSSDWGKGYIARARELNLFPENELVQGQKLRRSELKEIIFRLDLIAQTNSTSFKEELVNSVDYLTFFINKKEKRFLQDFSDTLGLLRNYYIYPNELAEEEPYRASTFAFIESLKDHYTNVYKASEFSNSPILPDQLDLGFSVRSKDLGGQDFYYYVGDIQPNSVPYKLGLRKNYIIEELIIGALPELSGLKDVEKTEALQYVTIVFRNSLNSLYKTEINFPVIVKDNSLANAELKDNLLYLRIRLFDKKTEEQFIALTKQLSKSDLSSLKGYILDLRGNPGGSVDTLMKLSEYLFKDQTIVFRYTDNLKKDHEVKTKTNPEFAEIWRKDIPWVILVDGNSASASEVLANALIDLKKGTKIIGQPSYGKGKMQVTFGIQQDSFVLSVTIAEILSPLGRKLDQVKLSPDILIEHGDNFLIFDRNKDLAIKKAKQLF